MLYLTESNQRELIEQSLAFLDFIVKRRAAYDSINKELEKLDGDFISQINMMDGETEKQIIALLDTIFGQEIASEFFYQHASAQPKNVIDKTGKERKIKTFDDVKNYVLKNAS